jgi:arsenite-transporting ATPase
MPGVADAALFDRVAALLTAPADAAGSSRWPGRPSPEQVASACDLVVFDTAPTGHALRLLRMPESMSAWVEALVRHRRQVSADEAVDRPGGQDPVLTVLEARAARLAEVKAALARPGHVAVVLVVIPERLPIEETARAAHALENAGLGPAAIIVNRVLPEHADGAYLAARRAQERRHLDEIGRRFSAVPRVAVPQFESDVHGLEALARVGRHLLADRSTRE